MTATTAVQLFGFAMVLACAVWIFFDARHLGVHRGRRGGGPIDAGPLAWALVVLLLWIVGFPLYLFARVRYVSLHEATPAPPHRSEDGRWWWDGERWNLLGETVDLGGTRS